MKVLCPNCAEEGTVAKLYTGVYSIFFCSQCGNAYTSPRPQNIEKYYSENYWVSPGFVGSARNVIYHMSQRRRVKWLISTLSKGRVLDIGSGEAEFGKSLPRRYGTINIEPLGSKVKNSKVLKKDFLTWHTNQKFDCICFWESLEHTPYPQKYLEKTYQLLNRNGVVFIEFPRFDSFESKFFGKRWFHLDAPRHLVHLTSSGVTYLLKKSEFKNISAKGVLSLEYSPWGFMASVFNTLNFNITDKTNKHGNFILKVLLVPLLIFSSIIEMLLWCIGESPIGLIVARKND